MIEIEKVGDIIKTFTITPDRKIMPKKIIYELSECKTYYNCQLYFDAVEDGKIREVILNIKAKSPEYAYDFRIIPDEDKEKTLFTLTVPDIGD